MMFKTRTFLYLIFLKLYIMFSDDLKIFAMSSSRCKLRVKKYMCHINIVYKNKEVMQYILFMFYAINEFQLRNMLSVLFKFVSCISAIVFIYIC